MKLDEVLATAGDRQLSDFDWGVTAVLLYNSLVSPDNYIDVSHTGKQAYEKLRRLPSLTLMTVLTREVQIEGTSVEFIGAVPELRTGVPPTVPQNQRKMSPVAIMLMIIMTVISLAMVFGSYRDPSTTDSNNDVLKTVIQSITELVKDEQADDKSAPTEHKDDPPQ